MRERLLWGVRLLAAALLLGMAAAAGRYFGGRLRDDETGSLKETPATVPARPETERAAPGPEEGAATGPAVEVASATEDAGAEVEVLASPEPAAQEDPVREEAETAVNSVLSANVPPAQGGDGNDAGAQGAAAATGTAELRRDDELLDLVTQESRLVTSRLSAENSLLRSEVEDLRRRNAKLGEALAAAQAALDRREERRAREEGAAREPVPDAPIESTVVDVNPELGMVVLDAGSRDGMRYGLALSVLRDRRRVAGIRVVDVRERIAGAVVEETARGEAPQTGDRAVLTRPAGSRGK
jgi:hypothetical protein